MHASHLLVHQPVHFELKDETASCELARQMASFLSPPLIMAFSGDLGAGKTTLIRAMLRALGVTGAIKSPTFSLVESYDLPRGGDVHHFDLYRILEEAELDDMGFRDYFSSDALCCIEWPERSAHVLSSADLLCSIQIQETQRCVTIQAFSALGAKFLSSLLEATG